MPTAFLLDLASPDRQVVSMSKTVRLTISGIIIAGLISVWVAAGALYALAISLTMLSYLFVLGMKNAAEEILRFEREQRPDLYA